MSNSNKSKLSSKQKQGQAKAEIVTPKGKTIKLGIDVHLDRYVVVRIIDGGTPQPPQRFEPAEFLLWVARQITMAEKVFTCYEAGPFGYSLHRKLEKMGATNETPSNWLCTWTATSTAITTRFAWCGCPAPNKSRSAASRGSGRVFSARNNAWPHKDAATPFIMASTCKANGGRKKLGRLRQRSCPRLLSTCWNPCAG